ncbi:MAG: hypothetical protein ACXWQE_13230, partial [Bdellovibrionales bacterium]
QVIKHNLIVFPYDSLPMITSRKQRAKLYEAVAQRLVSPGRFVLHFSSPNWVEKYVKETGRETLCDYTISSGDEIKVKRFSKPVSNTEFIKFISVECPKKGTRENYVALTAIVSEAEVVTDAAAAGLVLIERFGNFEKKVFAPSEDVILVFRKG